MSADSCQAGTQPGRRLASFRSLAHLPWAGAACGAAQGTGARPPVSPGFAATGGAGPGQEMLTASTPGSALTLRKPRLHPSRSQPLDPWDPRLLFQL